MESNTIIHCCVAEVKEKEDASYNDMDTLPVAKKLIDFSIYSDLFLDIPM